jgi:hypothetical protein
MLHIQLVFPQCTHWQGFLALFRSQILAAFIKVLQKTEQNSIFVKERPWQLTHTVAHS